MDGAITPVLTATAPIALSYKSQTVKFCPLALIHHGSPTARWSMFPGCVISMCSYDFIKYRPQPATRRSKVQKQGYSKEDKEILQDRQTDRCTHRTNLQPHVMYRLISRNTFGYSDMEKQNYNSSFSPRIFKYLSNSIIKLTIRWSNKQNDTWQFTNTDSGTKRYLHTIQNLS